MDNIKKFLESNEHSFVKYNTLTDIIRSSECNWLYLFDVDYYDNDIERILPENTIKFGKTSNDLWSRLNQYNENIRMRNIQAINCSFPKEREALLKRYLRYRTNYKPVYGQEYFCNCRDYIKILMLIIVSMLDEDIVLFTDIMHQKI